MAFNQIIILCFINALLFLHVDVIGQGYQSPSPADLADLQKAISEVLVETGAPAAGIAIVDRKGPVWVGAIGKADRERGIDATDKTMFRIGSTSKIFVALAVMKLQEEGKLNLKDRVRDLIPEIAFDNPWEETHPILVEHLLEHTTGWPDLHLPEHNQFTERVVPLKEALMFHPHSRVSHWVPGTRMSYSNIGPNVAAYIVEKITGRPYEDYIREYFFKPLGMQTATYRFSKEYQKFGAKLYKDGYPSAYGHYLMRASGSINASPREMSRLLQLMINRGKTDSASLITEQSLKRMETPSTTLGAREGLRYGYGLGLYTVNYKGFTYYKHGGGVGNSACDFSYLPDYGVGYCIMINSDNVGGVIWKIADLIRDFQTKNLVKIEENNVSGENIPVHSVDGYYHEVNPRTNPINFPSLSATRIWSDGDTLFLQEPVITGSTLRYTTHDGKLYQSTDSDKVELVLTTDPLAGEIFERANVHSGTVTYARLPALIFFGRYVILYLWIALTVISVLLTPLWLIRYWMGKIAGGANIKIRIWPLIPILFFFISFVFFAIGFDAGIEPLAKPGFISIGLMMGTIGFFASSWFALGMCLWYRRERLKPSVYFPATSLSVLHVLVATYLLWHGLIGLRTWA